ncbi:class I SAM-dependent methyltransferase [Thermoproteota archaeon]
MQPICDYSDYNYKSHFWGSGKRKYEHLCEHHLIRKLLQSLPKKPKTLLDAGCGFGRLYTAYSDIAENCILLDYAQNMLDQAKSTIGENEKVAFVQGNIYQIPLENSCCDTAVSVRVLHHIAEPSNFFSEIYRVLSPGGTFICEIPNKRHIINIIKYWILRFKNFVIKTNSPNSGDLLKELNPFSHTHLQLNHAYYNFHPKFIITLLQQQGFEISALKNTSFFRHRFFKWLFPPGLLFRIDQVLQTLLPVMNLTPSIFVLCRKESFKTVK